MFHICAAVSTHPSIYVLNDLVTLSQRSNIRHNCVEKKGKAMLIWKQKPKPQNQSHQENQQIFIVQVNFRLCNFAELLNTTIKHTVVFLSLEKYQWIKQIQSRWWIYCENNDVHYIIQHLNQTISALMFVHWLQYKYNHTNTPNRLYSGVTSWTVTILLLHFVE